MTGQLQLPHMSTRSLTACCLKICRAKSIEDGVIRCDTHLIQPKNLTLVLVFSITEPTTTVNSGAGTSTAGSSERTEDAFHQPADCHAANNFESESGMAIIPAMPTSTPLNTSTSNTRVDGTAADTEANDETDDDAQEDEDGGQSEIVVPQPPYIG